MPKLAVVACHFNPCQYRRPVENLKRFLHVIDRPVHIVELVLDDDVSVNDNDVISRGLHAWTTLRGTRAENWMWQKEALLNVGFAKALRDPEVTAVAWVDADVIFVNPRWEADTLRELERYDVVQMFSDASLTDSDERITTPVKSTGWHWSTYAKMWCDFAQSHPGMAWAMRASHLRRGFRLYDRAVTGNGDTLMLRAFTGVDPFRTSEVGSTVQNDVRRWANGELLSFGFVMGSIVHMHHGSLQDRDTRGRRLMLPGFSPREHVENDEQGLLKWSLTAPEAFRRKVQEYFQKRREDGVQLS